MSNWNYLTVKRQLFILFFGFLLYLLSGSLVLAQNFQFQTESNKVFQGKPEVDSLSKNNKLNQIIVTFKKKPTAGELIKLSRKSKKSRLKYAITGTDAMVFEVSEGVIQESLNELRADTKVESAVVDKALDLLYIPNDPAIKATPAPGKPILQWSLYNLNLVGSGRTAFDISKGSSGVTVAVLDSQVDSSHEDLQGKFSSLVDCSWIFLLSSSVFLNRTSSSCNSCENFIFVILLLFYQSLLLILPIFFPFFNKLINWSC